MSLLSGTTNSHPRIGSSRISLEAVIISALEERDYTELNSRRFQVTANRKLLGGKQFIRQIPVGDTIYETPRKVDFLIINRERFPNDLIIECRWQRSKGSVDEKFPFLLYNIVRTGVPTVILLDGGGYKPSALNWLKEMVNKNGALHAVWTLSEFQVQLNRGFM